MIRWLVSRIRRGLATQRPPGNESMNVCIAQAVSIFRFSPDLDEFAVFERLVSGGVERRLAARLVEFLPMAYVRVLLAKSGVRFPDCFERKLPSGALEKRLLVSEPVWNASLEFALDEASRGIPKADLMALAGRSAEFQAANELLNGGSKLDDVRFTPSLMLWPEGGPDA
jgi:hypothetical protein